MIRPLIFTAYGFSAEQRYSREPLASFFELGDAQDYAMHPHSRGFEDRACYVDAGRYDRRTAGYRPANNRRAEYEAWLAETRELASIFLTETQSDPFLDSMKRTVRV